MLSSAFRGLLSVGFEAHYFGGSRKDISEKQKRNEFSGKQIISRGLTIPNVWVLASRYELSGFIRPEAPPTDRAEKLLLSTLSEG